MSRKPSVMRVIFALTLTLVFTFRVSALSESAAIDAFTNFLDHYISPNNAKVAASINSTLFAENVKGSVDLSTNFDGRELATEYLFGLFVNIEQEQERPNPIGVPLSYNISAVMANNNFVFGSVKFDYYYPTLDIHLPIQVDAWLKFNEESQIEYYDVAFRRWAWAVDHISEYLLPQMAKWAKVDSTDQSKILTEFMMPVICDAHQKYCTGANQQYDSYEACAAFIRKTKLGTFYRMGEDNILCRNLHVPMLHLRPEVHCAHIGPTGGDMCNPRDYSQVVEDNHFPDMIATDCVTRLSSRTPGAKPIKTADHDELKRRWRNHAQCDYDPYRSRWWRL